MNMRSPGLFRVGGEYSDNLFPAFADKVYFRQSGKSGKTPGKHDRAADSQKQQAES